MPTHDGVTTDTLLNTPQREPRRLPVQLKIYALRVILLTVFSVALQATLTSVLLSGFTVATVDGTRLKAKDRNDLLDKYNSYSGYIAAAVAMPFSVLVNMVLPVFFLCFATAWVINENPTFVGQQVPKLVAIGVAWLLNQGITSINVQFESPSFTFAITESDLVAATANTTTAFAMSTITSAMNTDGHPSTDTILRSSINSQAPNPQSTCLSGKENTPDVPVASITYGYSSPSWIGSLLPNSVASESSVAFSMTDAVTEVDESALPGGDVDRSAVLFSYGYYLLVQQFMHSQFLYYGSEMIYNETKADTGVELVQNIQKIMQNATDRLTSPNATSTWSNLSHSEITMEFSTVHLSSQIKFEAITFELPLSMKTMAGYFGKRQTSSFSISLSTSSSCSDNACVLETPISENAIQDQVRIFRICQLSNESNVEDKFSFGIRPCPSIANSSVLVYSVAHHISADEYTYDSSSIKSLTIKNPRKTFSVTAGRLSWETEDLAEFYGAKCEADTNCNGLHFPLSNDSQHIVLGEAYVPVPSDFMDSEDPFMVVNWRTLAMAETQTNSTTQGDIFYPPNYKMAAGSDSWTTLTDYYCGFKWYKYVSQIAQDHLYSTDSYQPAYTASLFWLFQNAAAKDVVQTNPSSSTGIGLSFNGNRISLSSRVSMPKMSAYLSYVGCTLMLVLGVMIGASACSSSRQKALTQNFSPQNVAAVILDTKQYPPLLVQGSVAPGRSIVSRTAASGTFNDVSDVKIVDLALQGNSEDRDPPISSSDMELYTLSEG